MKDIRKRFASHGVQDALRVLAEMESHCDGIMYDTIRNVLEDHFLDNGNEVAELTKQGISPRVQVCNAVSNLVGDMSESGQYHVYRGVLGIEGEGLLRLFDLATDRIAAAGAIDSMLANKNKAQLRESIRGLG